MRYRTVNPAHFAISQYCLINSPRGPTNLKLCSVFWKRTRSPSISNEYWCYSLIKSSNPSRTELPEPLQTISDTRVHLVCVNFNSFPSLLAGCLRCFLNGHASRWVGAHVSYLTLAGIGISIPYVIDHFSEAEGELVEDLFQFMNFVQ